MEQRTVMQESAKRENKPETDWKHIKYKSFYTIIQEMRANSRTYAVVTPVANRENK